MARRRRPRRRARALMLAGAALGGVASLAAATPALGTTDGPKEGTFEYPFGLFIEGKGIAGTAFSGQATKVLQPGQRIGGREQHDGTLRGQATSPEGDSVRIDGAARYVWRPLPRPPVLQPRSGGDTLGLSLNFAFELSEGFDRSENQVAAAPVASAVSGTVTFDATRVDDNVPNAPQAKIPPQALANNHYKCYRVIGSSRSRPLQLRDQFATYRERAGRPFEICNPVRKVVGGTRTRIRDTRRHLVSYQLPARDPAAPFLGVRNQFGNVQLEAGRLAHVMVPSTKELRRGRRNALPPRRSSRGLDHFACYGAERVVETRSRVVNLTLVDQFERKRHRLGAVNSICNPTVKIDRGRTTPIRNPQAHLAGYRLSRTASPRRTIRVRNQFGRQTLVTGPATRILAPSAKRHCVSFVGVDLGIPVTSLATGAQVGTIDTVVFTPWAGHPQGACP